VLLKIVQAGEWVLRNVARPLTKEEILSRDLQQLIELMRETMYDAPGVGLAAPQIGEPIQVVVIEDRDVSMAGLSEAERLQRQRSAIPFHVLINPKLTIEDPTPVEFYEGCLSLSGFSAIVPRALGVRVEALDHRGEPVSIRAQGWYARILQHECDHLAGTLYIDRMLARSFTTNENNVRHWRGLTIAQVHEALALTRGPD
jgi:peptide deformylase